jgi:nitroreductase
MTTLPQLASRQADHPIEPLFIQRWSRRAFTGEPLPDAVLFSVLEAARWAPSGGNSQPWRFVYSRRGSASWDAFFDLLLPGNQRWAANASALILLASQTTRFRDGQRVKASSHSFDAGAAWAQLALQAEKLGWSTRAIGGFEKEKARLALGVPEDLALEVVIALGKPAEALALPADLQEKEAPNSRLPLSELAFEGRFPQPRAL